MFRSALKKIKVFCKAVYLFLDRTYTRPPCATCEVARKKHEREGGTDAHLVRCDWCAWDNANSV